MTVATDKQPGTALDVDIPLQRKLVQWSKYLVAVVIAVNFLVLFGWQFNIRFLTQLIPGQIPVNPTTALSFLIAGISFFLLLSGKKNYRIIDVILSSLIILFALLRLTDTIFDAGIYGDLFFYYEKINADAGRSFTRMGSGSAVNFLLTGISLLMFHAETRLGKMPAQIISFFIGVMGILAVLGYLYRVQSPYGLIRYIPMGLLSASCFIFLSVALLFANPGKGIMKEFTTKYTGSIIARRLIPAAIFIPCILGLLRLYGHWSGLFTTEFGVAILVLSIMVVFLIFIWYTVTLLNKRDMLKGHSDLALQKLQKQRKELFDTAPDATVIVNAKGIIEMINRQTEKLFGYKDSELVGQPVEILIPEELRGGHMAHVQKYIMEPKVRTMGAGMELQAVKYDGKRFPVEISLSPLETEEGMLVSASIRDITERKVSEQKFKALLKAAPDATVIVNENGLIELVNKQTEKLFGYIQEELVGRPVEILIPAALRSKHLGHVRNFAKEPRARSMGAGMELEAVKKDGQKFPVEISLAPLQTEEGLLITASIRDITDRKKLEQKFRSLLDSSPDATVIVNEKGFIEMISLQAESLFEYTREELIGQPVEILIPLELHNMHHHHVSKYIREPRVRAMGAGMELQAVKKGGRKFPVEISLSPLQTEEGILVSASIRDITERKQSEEKLRRFNEELELLVQERTLKIAESEGKYKTLIEEAVDAIAVISIQEKKYVAVNKKMSELTGYSREEIFNMSIMDMLLPEDLDTNPPKFDSLLKGVTTHNERLLKRKDGTVIAIESNAKILPDGSCLSFMRDITERRKNQAAMLTMNEQLRELSAHLQDIREEERVHIAREIHDELGQQLTAIKMDISTISKKIHIEDNDIITRVGSVLKMLDVAVQTVRRIASELRPGVLDDLGLITALEWQSQEFGNRTGLNIHCKLDLQDMEIDKQGSVAVFRIFQESLTNITRHAKATEVHVELRVKDEQLILQITDNGIGFDTQAIQNKRTLGLLGMKERAIMIGGSYEISSKPGAGTIVLVSVPLNVQVN